MDTSIGVRVYREEHRITVIIDNPTQEQIDALDKISGHGIKTVSGYEIESPKPVIPESVRTDSRPETVRKKAPGIEKEAFLKIIQDNKALEKLGLEGCLYSICRCLSKDEIRDVLKKLGIAKKYSTWTEQDKKRVFLSMLMYLRNKYPQQA